MRSPIERLVASCALLLASGLVACTSVDAEEPGSNLDASASGDAGADATEEASADAPAEATPDAPLDAASDPAVDVGSDTPLDTSPDANDANEANDANDAEPGDASTDDTGAADVATDAPPADGALDAAPDGGVAAADCTCPAGRKLCGATCVPIDDPAYGCTATGCSACAAVNGSTYGVAQSFACSAGACVLASCPPGWSTCPGQGICATDLGRPETCGACGHACAPGEKCASGSCVATCPPPLKDCGGSCVDPLGSVLHCGACDHACPRPVFYGAFGAESFRSTAATLATCTNGTCGVTCATGATLCGASCVDLQTSPEHCGACDHACPAPGGGDATCSAGQCGQACGPGLTLCGAACVSTLHDSAHCGGCGQPCGAGSECQEGSCVPSASLVLATNVGVPAQLVDDAAALYWVDPVAGTVRRLPKSGGSPELLAYGLGALRGIAVDDDYAYFTDATANQVLRVAKAGGSPTTLATATGPAAIVVDATTVYFSTRDGCTVAVEALPKAGGAPVTLASVTGLCAGDMPSLVADADGLYFTWPQEVRRVAGGTTTSFHVDQAGHVHAIESSIALGPSDLYWTGRATVGPLTSDGTQRRDKALAGPDVRLFAEPRCLGKVDGAWMHCGFTKWLTCGGPVVTVHPDPHADASLVGLDRVYWAKGGTLYAIAK